MASNMFKKRYIPNADGTDSTTPATNANTAFVHTYLGDDNTGDGTREKPYRSMNKAFQKSGITYVLFRGVINEYFYQTKIIIGDDKNQILFQSQYLPFISFYPPLFNLTTELNSAIQDLNGVICDASTLNLYHSNFVFYKNSIGGTFNMAGGGHVVGNCTFSSLINMNQKALENTKNILVVKKYGTKSNLTVNSFIYSVFLSSMVFIYNDINIVHPQLTDNSENNIDIIKNALLVAGMPTSIVNNIFTKNYFGNHTCKIIKEQRSGGTHPNVLNKYAPNIIGTLDAPITANTAKTSITITVSDASKVPDTGDFFIPFIGTYTNNGASITDGNEVFTYTSKTINTPTSVTLNGASYTFKMPHSAGVVCTRYGDVLDYTLNPDARNEALYASDTGGYVGCFAPAVKKEFSAFTAPANVNADGTDAGNGGDLMQFNDADGLTFNNASAQTWNRIRTTQIIEIQCGQTFNGLNVMSQDGSPFGYYVGKHQNLIGTDKIFAGGNLTAGKIYKIFNDTAKNTTRGIIYNGVNYFPECTFVCVAGTLSFAEINPGSGTYVREVLADVLESVEVLPYDDVATPSAFPRFSAPLMGEPKLILYTATGAARYGKAIGAPVLFSHLKEANFITDFGGINDKIAYYDSFAVSNADQEFYRLTNAELSATLKGYFKTDIPLLKFLHLEINGHFDEPYDY